MKYKGYSKLIKHGQWIENKKRYEIKDVLSIGSVANIYLAKSDEMVVVKQFFTKDKNFFELQKEILKLDHPILLQNYDFFEFSGYYFLIREYIDEVISLDDIVMSEVGFEQRIEIAKKIVEFVDFIHKKDIIHTDLKPEQFMFVKKYNDFKMIDFDFGITKSAYYPGGTVEWYSPEHFKKEKITKKSEIYTLGLILHYILYKKHPFDGFFEDYESLRNAILGNKFEVNDDFFKKVFLREASLEDIKEFLGMNVPKKIYLINNSKKYLVFKDKLITRDLCKQIFKNYKDIAPKHFWILKKEDGWYVKGLEDPRFKRVFVDGVDATNKEIKIKENSVIKIGDTEFTIKRM